MRSHKEILAWQLAHRVVMRVFGDLGKQWTPATGVIFEQLRRSALSVQLNIAEGYASGPGARCRNHFRIAYGSAVEATELLELLEELGNATGPVLEESRRSQALTLRLFQRSRKS
jgi:four helix bundle protein